MKTTPVRRRKMNKSTLINGPDQMLKTMLRDADPIFKRRTPRNKQRNPPSFLATTNTRFDDRVLCAYDPGMKDKNYERWNVAKIGVLESMKASKGTFTSNPELLKKINDVHNITQFQRNFPTYQRIMGLAPTSVKNDAHNKSTNPGYTRNWNGKPFFS